MKPEMDQAIAKVLQEGKFILGPEVQELERLLCSYVGVKHAVGVANWTDGLMVCMMALGLQPGDEVITPAFSFIASSETIAILGAKPVFVDIDPRTYNLDVTQLRKAITTKTKCIMPVSLYGQCADMDAIAAVAKEFNIPVLEDAAQSFGALYRGRRSGALSEISGTSFFPSKPLGCYGDGGICFTDDDLLADRLKKIRSHGQEARYNHVLLGVNSRLDTVQAAVLLVKMKYFDREIELRNQVASWYHQLLPTRIDRPVVLDGYTSVWAQYTIEVDQREPLREALQKEGIPTAVHYPKPLHLQPAFSYLGYQVGDFPISERASQRVLSLPMHPYLSREEVGYICERLQFHLS